MVWTILFDYDGVIVNSDPFNKFALQQVLSKWRLPFSQDIYVKFFLGRTLVDGLNLYMKLYNIPNEDIPHLIEGKKSFDKEYLNWVMPYESTIKFLHKIRGRFVLGLVTGSRWSMVSQALKKFRIDGYFRVVVTAEDNCIGKPDPAPFLTALKRLEDVEKEAVVIGDSPLDIQAAHSTGLHCIAILNTHSQSQLIDADLIVSSLDQIDLEQLAKM